MRITRVYTGDDGRSHFEDIEVAFSEKAMMGASTTRFPADNFGIREAASDIEMDFHNAPLRQFVITLGGRVEIECGDGEKRQFGPGEVFLADDATGQGHITRIVEAPRYSAVIPMSDDFDLDALRA